MVTPQALISLPWYSLALISTCLYVSMGALTAIVSYRFGGTRDSTNLNFHFWFWWYVLVLAVSLGAVYLVTMPGVAARKLGDRLATKPARRDPVELE